MEISICEIAGGICRLPAVVADFAALAGFPADQPLVFQLGLLKLSLMPTPLKWSDFRYLAGSTIWSRKNTSCSLQSANAV